jgi:hypothetical protein
MASRRRIVLGMANAVFDDRGYKLCPGLLHLGRKNCVPSALVSVCLRMAVDQTARLSDAETFADFF